MHCVHSFWSQIDASQRDIQVSSLLVRLIFLAHTFTWLEVLLVPKSIFFQKHGEVSIFPGPIAKQPTSKSPLTNQPCKNKKYLHGASQEDKFSPAIKCNGVCLSIFIRIFQRLSLLKTLQKLWIDYMIKELLNGFEEWSKIDLQNRLA